MKRNVTLLVAFALCLSPLAAAGESRVVFEGVFAPGERSVTFAVPDGAESFALGVVNGSDKGVDRVSSAVVTLNGKTLYTQKDFNQNVASLSASLPKGSLAGDGNVLAVGVKGRSDSFLKVTITGAYPAVTVTAPPPAPAMVAWYPDRDGDGPMMFPAGVPAPPGPVPYVIRGGDCNDMNPMVFPGNGCP
jgi:hypothetical protein